jgi:hypothetical protein
MGTGDSGSFVQFSYPQIAFHMMKYHHAEALPAFLEATWLFIDIAGRVNIFVTKAELDT